MKTLFKILMLCLLVQLASCAAPKYVKRSGVPLKHRVQYANRQHRTKLFQQALHVQGDQWFNWERRPKGHWPFEFLQ